MSFFSLPEQPPTYLAIWATDTFPPLKMPPFPFSKPAPFLLPYEPIYYWTADSPKADETKSFAASTCNTLFNIGVMMVPQLRLFSSPGASSHFQTTTHNSRVTITADNKYATTGWIARIRRKWNLQHSSTLASWWCRGGGCFRILVRCRLPNRNTQLESDNNINRNETDQRQQCGASASLDKQG